MMEMQEARAKTSKATTEASAAQTKAGQDQQAFMGRAQFIKSRMPELTDEMVMGLASDPAVARELLKDPSVKIVTKEIDGRVKVYKETPQGLEFLQDLGSAVDRTPRVNVAVNASTTAETEYSKSVGKATAERDVSDIETAQAVSQTLPKMYETLNLIKTGNLNTGLGAEAFTVLDRARTKFLSDPKAKQRVNDTEYLDALLGSDVFPQISALGIGARGLDTPAEREFLRQVITGTISLDQKTLERMTEFRIKAAERAVKKYNERLNSGGFEQYQRITNRQLSPVSAQAPLGTASNPIKLD
jgi:hypothetical protein